MIKKLKFLLLIIIPLFFLITGLQFERVKYTSDPESAYLMNGVNIAMWKTVGHHDHPGTTVQTYNALVLRMTHFFRFSDNDFQTDVLLNSEYYIEVLRKSFIAVNAYVLLILGLVTFLFLGSFLAGLLLQIAPFLSVTLVQELFTKIAPEQFLFTVTAVLTMLLIKFYISRDQCWKGYPLLFGLIGGFGMATKITFLPILVIPFLLLKGKLNKLIYVVSIIFSFVLFTLPAVPRYPAMFDWVFNIGTHTGIYGAGNTGFIDSAVYFSSLNSIIENNKSMIAVMLLSVVVLLFTLFVVEKQQLLPKKH